MTHRERAIEIAMKVDKATSFDQIVDILETELSGDEAITLSDDFDLATVPIGGRIAIDGRTYERTGPDEWRRAHGIHSFGNSNLHTMGGF